MNRVEDSQEGLLNRRLRELTPETSSLSVQVYK